MGTWLICIVISWAAISRLGCKHHLETFLRNIYIMYDTKSVNIDLDDYSFAIKFW